MKKCCRNGLIGLLLLIVTAVMFTPMTSKAYTNSYTRDGAVLWACARGNERWWADVDNAYGCQCVDLILAYYQLLAGYTVGGNACDYQWNELPSGWTRVSTPAPGDIVVWAPGAQLIGGSDPRWANGTYGHIGIVWAVYDDGTMGTIETNARQGEAAAYYQRYTWTPACYIRPDFPPALGVKSGTSTTNTTITWSDDPNWDIYNLGIKKLTSGSYTTYKEIYNIKDTSYSLVLPKGSYQVFVIGYKSSNLNAFAQSLSVNFTVAAGTPVYKVGSASLSASTYVYNGKARKPSVTVKNTSGKTLVNGTDYKVTYASGRTKVGRYKVTITFKGNYSGKKELYFNIVPAAVKSPKAELYTNYNTVKLSWKKSTGATGYYIYAKKSAASSYSLLGYVTGTACRVTDLAAGTKFDFMIVPYYQPAGSATRYYLTSVGKTVKATTLMKMPAPSIKKSGTKVKVSWKNIGGETGYQISQAASKKATKIVSTYKTTTGKSKKINAKKGKTFYYKVRAYKKVGNTKIYGPWSEVKAFKR